MKELTLRIFIAVTSPRHGPNVPKRAGTGVEPGPLCAGSSFLEISLPWSPIVSAEAKNDPRATSGAKCKTARDGRSGKSGIV